MKQTMLIVGLGLIGGSLALALKGFEDFEIVGVDVSQPTLRYAAEHGVGDRVTEDAAAELPQADVVALALHPQGRSSVEEVYGGDIHVFERPIEYSIKVAECPAAGQSILTYAPKNAAADSYRSLAREVLSLG